MRRALAAVALCGGLACVLPAQPPGPGGPKLTAEETAARLEKAGSDPVALLELVPLLGEKEAVRIRQRIHALLLEQKPLAGPEEVDELRRRLARGLPVAARTPVAVRELLGPPRLVLRQVLYRRYVEQWHYDTPLTLCVVLEGVKGQGPQVQNVLVPGAGKP
jgi:hypothetical protein